MSAKVVPDRDGNYQVVVNGKPLPGPDGRPLVFEDYQRAQEVAEDRGGDR